VTQTAYFAQQRLYRLRTVIDASTIIDSTSTCKSASCATTSKVTRSRSRRGRRAMVIHGRRACAYTLNTRWHVTGEGARAPSQGCYLRPTSGYYAQAAGAHFIDCGGLLPSVSHEDNAGRQARCEGLASLCTLEVLIWPFLHS